MLLLLLVVVGYGTACSGGETTQSSLECAEAAQIALGGFHWYALGTLNGWPDFLFCAGCVWRRHCDEHIPEIIFDGENTVGCAGNPAGAGIAKRARMLFRARPRSFRGAVGHKEGYIVDADGEKGSEALRGGRRVEEIEDGGGNVGENRDVVHLKSVSMATNEVQEARGEDTYQSYRSR